jgi:hypothetical protein
LARPEVACEGRKMRIPEKRAEGLQIQGYMETVTERG